MSTKCLEEAVSAAGIHAMPVEVSAPRFYKEASPTMSEMEWLKGGALRSESCGWMGRRLSEMFFSFQRNKKKMDDVDEGQAS